MSLEFVSIKEEPTWDDENDESAAPAVPYTNQVKLELNAHPKVKQEFGVHPKVKLEVETHENKVEFKKNDKHEVETHQVEVKGNHNIKDEVTRNHKIKVEVEIEPQPLPPQVAVWSSQDEPLSPATRQANTVTPKTHVSEDDSTYFTNNRANLKRKPHDLLSRKRKLESNLPEKQSVSERFKVLASEKMEFLEMQKELLNSQLTKEKESLEHQRFLWSMEVEDAKAKYAHNAELRQLELQKLNK